MRPRRPLGVSGLNLRGVQKPPQSKRIRWIMRAMNLCCLIVLGVLAAGPAGAGPARGGGPIAGPMRLGEVLFGAHGDDAMQPVAPPVARYALDGGVDFILDRSSSPPLLRFEDSSEIWVLQPGPGPRGDVIYRNDVGEPVLRATRLGGLTLFTPQRPAGAAAAYEGEASAIRPPLILSPNMLLQRLAQCSARASRAVQHLVVFDAPDVTADSASLIADTAAVAAEAIGDLARRTEMQHGLSRLSKVLLIPGRKPYATMSDTVLTVVITPQQGLAGRPSSRWIAVALAR
jgi:hypothetical protein